MLDKEIWTSKKLENETCIICACHENVELRSQEGVDTLIPEKWKPPRNVVMCFNCGHRTHDTYTKPEYALKAWKLQKVLRDNYNG